VPLPLLITGIPGVPGYNALHYFQARYPGRVFGIRQADNTRLAGPGILACSAEDRREMARLFDRYQFASVLDCAGNCALKACELNPDLARRINIEGVANILSQTVPRGIRLVHLSVDLVFSGRRNGDGDDDNGGDSGYVEDDPIDPVTVYGKTMAEGERLLLESDPAACILRISLPMGVSFNGHAGAIDWIASRFRKSRPATLYFDEVRTPTYTDCMNRLYEVLLANGASGIFHAGGPRRLTLYQIAQIINRAGGYDPKLLLGIPRREAGPIPPRAGNVSMQSGKLIRALGYNPFDPWPLADDLLPTDRRWHFDRRPEDRGSAEYLYRQLCMNPAHNGEPVHPSQWHRYRIVGRPTAAVRPEERRR
jgi:dTDP-4-dehydrorhamnose reductase